MRKRLVTIIWQAAALTAEGAFWYCAGILAWGEADSGAALTIAAVVAVLLGVPRTWPTNDDELQANAKARLHVVALVAGFLPFYAWATGRL